MQTPSSRSSLSSATRWTTPESCEPLEAKLAEDERMVVDEARQGTPRVASRLLSTCFESLPAILSVAVLVLYPILGFTVGWGTPFVWMTQGAGLVATAAGLSLALYFVFRRVAKRLVAQRQTRQRAASGALQAQALQDTAAVPHQVRAAGDPPLAWRAPPGKSAKPTYATELTITSPTGLDTTSDRRLEISTPAHVQLRFMLEHMRGASIGIAGPRGAGKSTLVQSFCGDHVERIGPRDALTVTTSAPVEYQSRDFLLHLFASLCHRTIERLDASYERSQWKERITSQAKSSQDIFYLLLWTALAGMVMAALMLIGSFALATITLDQQLAAQVAASAPAATPPAAAASGSAPPNRVPAPVTLPMILAEVGVTSGTLFGASLAVLAAASMLLAIVALKAGRTNRPVLETTLSPGPASELPAPRVLSTGWFSGLFKTFKKRGSAPPAHPLVREAQRWLSEIKFQQSYTIGWSGALKLPLGVEGSLNQARSLAQLQMSLPEIVDAFVQFLGRITTRFTVVIGIDELDKIESDEKARHFLNDIKAVFGIPNVFFLVSVSENAMSQFERRGLPYRDAFDSAFDDVIAVDYLSFDFTGRMLAERVQAMPLQFQALCYAMSGGLAREVVRTARDLVELTPHAGIRAPRDLASLTAALVERELKAKVRAVINSAERLDAPRERAALLERLHALVAQPVSAQRLYDIQRSLITVEPDLRRRRHLPTPGNEAGRARDLSEEIGTYCYFLACVLRFFDNRLDKALLTHALEHGWVDILAHSLRSQSMNTALARTALDSFLRHIGREFRPTVTSP